MSTDLLVAAREADGSPGGGWMALVSTSVTLVLLVGAGVWWVAVGRGGEDKAAAEAKAAAGRVSGIAAETAPVAGVAAAPAAGERVFYFLVVDSAAQAAAVREQWDESNRRRVLYGLRELDGSVFTVEPDDDMGWLYRSVAFVEGAEPPDGLSAVEVLDLRGGVAMAPAGSGPSRCTPDCDALDGMAEMYREQGGGPNPRPLP